MSDLQTLYANRFSARAEERKNRLWAEICRYLRKFIPKDAGTVVDVAAGYCDFINNIGVGTRKFALDLNPDVQKFAASDVTAIVGDVEESMKNQFSENSVSLFFMSNFLEHIAKEKISSLLKAQYKLLENGGGGYTYPHPEHQVCRRQVLGLLRPHHADYGKRAHRGGGGCRL